MAKKKAEMTKEERISAEFRRLKKLCKGLSEKKLALALPLVEQAAFMRITLADLAKETNEIGCVEEYQNGKNQQGMKSSASVQTYNSMVKSFAAVTERLDRMLPDTASVGSKLSALLDDE